MSNWERRYGTAAMMRRLADMVECGCVDVDEVAMEYCMLRRATRLELRFTVGDCLVADHQPSREERDAYPEASQLPSARLLPGGDD